uniref:Uncharacterized protein n=1 Tax=Acrobeloides nanus TaxID=290746 RepID=A0A914C0C5_9BILA
MTSKKIIGNVVFDENDKIYTEKTNADHVLYRGTIMEDFDKLIDNRVVVKSIDLKSKGEKPRERELQALKSLRHPNIIYCHGIKFGKSRWYFVLDFYPFSLYDVIELYDKKDENAKYFEADRIKILKQLADGLGYLHDSKIIHRNLKPTKVLLKEDFIGNIVAAISDFGFSKKLDKGNECSFAGKDMGPIGWMAPEIENEKTHDFSADIFSLGCLAYYMFTDGRCLFAIENHDENFPRIMQDNINKNKSKIVKDQMFELDTKYTDDIYSTFCIISSMVEHEEDKRPSAKDIKFHPLFWKADRKLKFIKTVRNVEKIERKTKEWPKKVINALEKKAKDHKAEDDKAKEYIYVDVTGKSFNNWIDMIRVDKIYPHLGEKFAEYVFNASIKFVESDNNKTQPPMTESDPKSTYGYHRREICYLLRLIRNFNEHKEHNFKLDDGITCFTKIFPKMLVEVYKTMEQFKDEYTDLKEFYPNELGNLTKKLGQLSF